MQKQKVHRASRGHNQKIKFREREKEDRFFDPDVKGEGTKEGDFIEKSLGMVGR
jgi:hypothetical protein